MTLISQRLFFMVAKWLQWNHNSVIVERYLNEYNKRYNYSYNR